MTQPSPLAAAAATVLILAGLVALGHYLLERQRDDQKAQKIALEIERLVHRLEEDDLEGIESAYDVIAREVATLHHVPPMLEEQLAALGDTLRRLRAENCTECDTPSSPPKTAPAPAQP